MSRKEVKAQPQAVKSIEELMLNYQADKYSAIPLAALWAKELRRKEENRHLTANEILELALRDVLSGVVDWESIAHAISVDAAGNGDLLGFVSGKEEGRKVKD